MKEYRNKLDALSSAVLKAYLDSVMFVTIVPIANDKRKTSNFLFDYSYYTFDDIEGDFIVMLDHLTDPHNFGAIIRTCESKGIKTIIIPKDRSVLVNDTVYKTSEGAIDNVKIVMVTNLINTINKLKEMNYFVYCADMDGEDYRKVSYANKKVLVIGNEGLGISSGVKKNSDVVVGIPMKGKINSLNASVSAGILIYRMDD